jgi:probable biosynthetic protein (TIGR04099 family)
MTIPLGILQIDRILGGPAMPAIADHVVLGMPHLCFGGLSETWLLKECGHRHWFLLAHAAGRDVPDFRDASGEPIYAAFVSVSVRESRFHAAREHDELAFEAQLARFSRARFVSQHRLAVRGLPIGEVVMTSTFVRRTRPGSNRSIARAELPSPPAVEHAPHLDRYQEMIGRLRHGRWTRHMGLRHANTPVLNRLAIDPCPSQDFNGADFLYFSSFQAFVDRAEHAFFRLNPRTTTRHRDIVYHGNIEPGDRVVVMLRDVHREAVDDNVLAHWCSIEREADAAPLADVFTLRGP